MARRRDRQAIADIRLELTFGDDGSCTASVFPIWENGTTQLFPTYEFEPSMCHPQPKVPLTESQRGLLRDEAIWQGRKLGYAMLPGLSNSLIDVYFRED